MTDDLVKRLREHINSIPVRNIQGRTFHGWEPDTLIEQAADRIEKLEAVTKDDAGWLAAYHKWCEMNGCAPSSSDLIAARKALEGGDDLAG